MLSDFLGVTVGGGATKDKGQPMTNETRDIRDLSKAYIAGHIHITAVLSNEQVDS